MIDIVYLGAVGQTGLKHNLLIFVRSSTFSRGVAKSNISSNSPIRLSSVSSCMIEYLSELMPVTARIAYNEENSKNNGESIL